MLEPLNVTTVDLAHSAARLGVGVFETVRVEAGEPRLLPLHLERLARGAAFLEMPEPPPAARVAAHAAALTRGLELGVLRLLAVDRALLLAAAPWAPRLPEAVRVATSSTIVRCSSSPLSRFKTLSYLENVLLGREAGACGLFDAIALNERGRLTDGGRTNVFAVLGGAVLTPPESDGALPGVVRRVLLEAGLATPRSLTPADLSAAEAVLLTNALHGVVAAHEVAGGPPLDTRHPALLAARAAWRSAVDAPGAGTLTDREPAPPDARPAG